ncbi:type III-B CRISPR module RAMP protein Cmr4 [Hydrogenobacter sp. Uz 6-8]|uniref:type III-B CRISPR module RAMP protein Cmr4 n=1 Tax=Hydrogenobacter sp. Uz 6-8 TaxID=3384828 RepID=UPI0038FCC988
MNRRTYLLKVLTPLHVGAGQGLSHVDPPIVREVHTGFPLVPGSSLKGCIREYHLRRVWREYFADKGVNLSDLDEEVSSGRKKLRAINEDSFKKDLEYMRQVFGTAGELEEGNAGKVVFTDARLLFFPVRSVSHIFLLVTCPYALQRYARDTGKEIRVESPKDSEAFCYSMEVAIDNRVMLEEFVFDAKPAGEGLVGFVNSLGIEDKQRVVLVSDTVFSELVQSYTEVQTHVKIDPDSGTVKEGDLWTTEYLPAESVLYVNFFVEDGVEFSAPSEIWLGGDMTTGKGLVKLREVKP